MMHQPNDSALLSLFSAVILGTTTHTTLAGNFTIDPAPGHPRIISVKPGSTASAYYTVTNQTMKTLSGYVLQGSPNTVIHNGTSPYCSNPVILSAGASCELRLDISGRAKSSFALCKGDNCTTASVPLDVDLSSPLLQPAVSVGGYGVNIYSPLMVESNLEGVVTVAFPPLPADSPTRMIPPLLSASCDQTITRSPYCIAVGFYRDGSTYPLLYDTLGGNVWRLLISATSLPTAYDSMGMLVSSSCANSGSGNPDSYCVAVGSYTAGTSGVDGTIPLAYRTTRAGLTNGYVIEYPITTEELSDFNSGHFASVSCNAATCVAAGGYYANNPPPQNGITFSPLAATSSDAGQTWSYTMDSTTPSNPTDYLYSNGFNNVNCSLNQQGTGSETCIAVGSYTTVSSSPFIAPLIAVSVDAGLTWNYNLDSSTAGFPTAQAYSGVFNSVSCSGISSLNCVAVGSYQTSESFSSKKLLMANSSDGGNTWTYVMRTPPSGIPTSFYSSVSCGAITPTCMAVGTGYDPQQNTLGLIDLSTDGGQTWTLQPIVKRSPLSDVSCGNTGCAISGLERAPSDPTTSPLLLSYVYDSSIMTPIVNNSRTDLTPGLLNSASIGNAF